MDWTTYHRDVDITANGTTRSLKIDTLTVTAEPYLFGREGDSAVQLFDGRHVQQVDAWHHRVEFEWAELPQTIHDRLRGTIVDTVTAGNATIDFDPVNDPGNKTLTVVIQSASDSIQAAFSGGVRERPANMTWITEDTQTDPVSWLTT